VDDIQHNDIQHNDFQHNIKNNTSLIIIALNPECCYAKFYSCRVAFMLSVTNKAIRLSFIMLNVFMLSDLMLNVVMLSVITLNVMVPEQM